MDHLDYGSRFAALSSLLAAEGIGCFFLKTDFSNVALSDNGIKADLFSNYDYESFRNAYAWGASAEGEICIFMDELHIHDIIVHFPSSFALEGDVAVFGPFVFQWDVDVLLGRYDDIAGAGMVPVLKQNLEAIHRVGENHMDRNYFAKACSLLFHHAFSVRWYPYDVVDDPVDGLSRYRPKSFDEVHLDNIEERYRMENRFLAAIQNGDAKEALDAYDMFISMGSLQRRIPSMVRNRQNYLIILNTLSRKAAEKAGVHPLYIDSCSTRFSLEISNANTVGHLVNISRWIIEAYSELVRNKAMSGCSRSVREIVVYTDFHYSENLNLSFFSNRFNVSKTHLSSLFHREMGMTITDYVRKVRIEAACQMLLSTSSGLAEIASLCGYEGPNYFIRQFRAEKGMTPRQYRDARTKRRF